MPHHSPVPQSATPHRQRETAGMTEVSDLMTLMPFAGHVGVQLVSADANRAEARLTWAPHLCTAGGVVHGGALMTLADSVGAMVAFLGLPEGASTATITSTTQLFRPVTSGEVRAVAETLHRGRTTVTVRTSLYDDRDRLV